VGSARVPNGGGLVKLRSSGAKRQWRLFSTNRIGDETSPVFLVTNCLCCKFGRVRPNLQRNMKRRRHHE
jgi:hypothetical protein